MASDDNRTQALDLFEGRKYKLKQGDRNICVGVALTLLANYLFNRGDDESFDPYAVSRCLEEHVRDVFWKIILEDIKNGPKPVPSKIESVEDYLRRKIYSKKALPGAIENIGKQEWEKGNNNDSWKFGTVKDYFCAGTDGYFQRETVDGEIIGHLNNLLNGIVEGILLEQNEKSTFYAVREAFFPHEGKMPKFGFVCGCEHRELRAGSCLLHGCNKCMESVYKLDFIDKVSAYNSIEANTPEDIKTCLWRDRIPILMMIPGAWIEQSDAQHMPDHAVLATGYTVSDKAADFDFTYYDGSDYNKNCNVRPLKSQYFNKIDVNSGHQPILLPIKMTWGTDERFYDVFISYRYASSRKQADYVYEQLKMEGYSVYKARKEDSGEAANTGPQCLRLVRSTKVFVLILSRDCFNELKPEYTFWKEIEYAYKAEKTVFIMLDDESFWENAREELAKITGKKPKDFNPIYNPKHSPWLLKFNHTTFREAKVKGKWNEVFYTQLSPEDNIIQNFIDVFIKNMNTSLFIINEQEIDVSNKKVWSIRGWSLQCKQQDDAGTILQEWVGKYFLLLMIQLKPSVELGEEKDKLQAKNQGESVSSAELHEYFKMIKSSKWAPTSILGYCVIFMSDEHFNEEQIILSNGLKIGIKCLDGYQQQGLFTSYIIEERKKEDKKEYGYIKNSMCPKLSINLLDPLFDNMYSKNLLDIRNSKKIK